MWAELITCIESDTDFKHKMSFLNTLINVHSINLENENEIKLVKTKIKDFCADHTTRTAGLLLLYAVVRCSSTLYVENWSQIVLGALQIPDSLVSREIPLKVMNRMLVNFAHYSDYKDVFYKVIPEILPILLNPEDDKLYKLSCQSLAICMKCVPVIMGTSVADIERLLLKELDNPYGEIVEAVGECFAALPNCIFRLQKKDENVKYKDIWGNIVEKILNTIHLVLNKLMRLTEDQGEYVDLRSKKVFEIALDHVIDIPLSLIDIIKSFCVCMAKMMSSKTGLVRLPVKALLDTLFRIIQIVKIIPKHNLDQWIGYLKLGYSQLLNGVYLVFEALILNFTLLDQSQNFVKLCNMSLSAMDEHSFSQSCVSQVRGSTWKLINIWLMQYGCKGSYAIAKDDTLLEQILADIDIGEKEMLESKQLETNNTNQNTNRVSACTHALKVLKNILETSSNYMEKNHLEEIYSTLLRISRFVVRWVSPTEPSPLPYSDEKCRKMLYDVLLCCALHSDVVQSKCILEAQSIFNIASSKDTSTKVRRICHRFRKLSRYYLNPQKPPPDAVQYSHPTMLKRVLQPVIQSVRSDWENGTEWNNDGGHSSDQMDDNEVPQVQGENAYSDKMESEGDLMTIEQTDEENESRMNHSYRRKSSQSVGEEESIDDSDIEPTYVSTDSNPQRIGMNDSSHINSFGIQSCAEQYANETRTERCTSEEVVSNLTNNVENDIEEEVSAFVEVKSAVQKPLQVHMGNGEWRKKENVNESDEDDSDMEEEGDEEGEANEELSDTAADEASDGKRSPEFDEERPNKRQKCMDEEGDDDVDEDVEDEDIPVNNQSSDEEEASEVNNLPVVEKNAENNSENVIQEEEEEESQGEVGDNGCKSPTIREMISTFVLAEPTAPEIS